MELDLDLYRQEIRVSASPLVRLSAIDISPDQPQRTFVFLHGFGGQAEQWHYQLQDFSLENRVIALDMRGHGLSDAPASGYSMEQAITDLETALILLKVKGKFVLVGHSFGGAWATEYAIKHPDRVERLLLIATAGEFQLRPLFKLGLSMPYTLLRLIGPLTRGWLSAPPSVLKQIYHHNLSKWIGWERFKCLTVPTLVIRGNRDRVFQKPLYAKVTESIPGAEDADIGVSGHMVMLERRDAVNRTIARFLEGEGQRSWRETPGELQEKKPGRDRLRKTRSWLARYEPGV